MVVIYSFFVFSMYFHRFDCKIFAVEKVCNDGYIVKCRHLLVDFIISSVRNDSYELRYVI